MTMQTKSKTGVRIISSLFIVGMMLIICAVPVGFILFTPYLRAKKSDLDLGFFYAIVMTVAMAVIGAILVLFTMWYFRRDSSVNNVTKAQNE